jgi:pSer/pThr/pTyr-binding forkhead associated (FHA) protein
VIAKKNAETNYFLVCQHTKTIRLNRVQPITVGREKYNDVVLNDLLVSRQHSVIQWEDDHFIIKDMKSRNGTFLNNERIDMAILADGDVIKIGGYDFKVRTASQSDIEKFLLQERVRMSSQETLVDSDLGLRFNDRGFSGDLNALALIEVVQTLSQCIKTGLLKIMAAQESPDPAIIYFLDGEMVHATYQDLSGLPAIMSILQLNEGQFEFLNDIPTPETTVQQSSLSILLEACRLRDESQRQQTNS